MTDLPRQGDAGPAFDMLSLAADDEVVTALAAGREVDDDELTSLLTQFRRALDDGYAAAGIADAPIPVPPVRRGRRLHRTAALGVATVAVAASLTGVAAAVGGNANPLHRAIVGLVDSRPDPSFRQAQQLLRQAERLTDSARDRGWIGDADRSTVLSLVDRVVVLAADADADGSRRRSLAARVSALRAELGALPSAPPPAEVEDQPSTGTEPGDDGGEQHASPTPEATTDDSGSRDSGESDGGSGSTSDAGTISGSGSDDRSGSTDSGGTSGSDGGTDSHEASSDATSSGSDAGSAVLPGLDGSGGSDGSEGSDGSDDGSHSG